MPDLTIILRTCDKVEKFSTHNGLPRIFGHKSDIIKRCYTSLSNSIDYAIDKNIKLDFIIIDDKSSKDIKHHLVYNGPLKFSSPLLLYNVNGNGNGDSLRTCYQYAKDNCEDQLIFFIEDDYLFEESAIYECYKMALDAPNVFNKDVCIHPVDYPDRYTNLYPSWIVLGEKRHWRTIQHTTGTFLINHKILIDQWDKYWAFAKIGKEPGVTEDTTINAVYKTYPCLSPIPTLAEHYQEEFTLSPFSKHKQ